MQSIEGLNRKKNVEEGRIHLFCFLPAYLDELGYWSSAFGLGFIPVDCPYSQTLAFGLNELHCWLSWISSLQTADCGTSQSS